MTPVLETARHAVPIADAGSGAVVVGVGMMTTIVAIDPTTTTTGLLRPGMIMMTAPDRVAEVVEESIVVVLRGVLMAIEADFVRLIGKDHEVGRSSVRSVGTPPCSFYNNIMSLHALQTIREMNSSRLMPALRLRRLQALYVFV